MKDYSTAQLYDLQRKASLEICKRLLSTERVITTMDVFLKLTVDLKTSPEEKNLPHLAQKGLTQYLETIKLPLAYGSELEIKNCHISRTTPQEMMAA